MGDTYVLVTGAWHCGWGWRPVAQHLRAAGHRVLTPTLPGLADGDDPTAYSLDDVCQSVADLIEQQDEQVILVGHSWGGYVITGAAQRVPSKLKGLIYWSAFVPAEGATLYDEVPPPYQELFDGMAGASGNNTVAMPLEVWQQAFAQDAVPEVQELLHQLLVPHPMQYFTETVPAFDPVGAGIPTTYILSEDDVALPPGEFGWNRFPGRIGLEPVKGPGSHEALFTRPEELARAFMDAAA